jgi:uncharacterized protein (DUF305 family)
MSKNMIYGVIAVLSTLLLATGVYAITNSTKNTVVVNLPQATSSISSATSKDGCPAGQSKRLMPSMCMIDPELTTSSSSIILGKDGCPSGQSKRLMPSMCMIDSQLTGKAEDSMMMMQGDSMMMSMVESEKQFIQDMIPHHQEAVDSSQKLLTVTQDAELKSFMQNIITNQSKEIVDMKSWYKQWYGSEYKDDGKYIAMMRDTTKLSVKEQEKTYLEDMVGHHQMAVVMAKEVLALSNIMNETKQLANSIVSSQNTEISTMKNWLTNKY